MGKEKFKTFINTSRYKKACSFKGSVFLKKNLYTYSIFNFCITGHLCIVALGQYALLKALCLGFSGCFKLE